MIYNIYNEKFTNFRSIALKYLMHCLPSKRNKPKICYNPQLLYFHSHKFLQDQFSPHTMNFWEYLHVESVR